nr:MAG TPA: hypothetical protein [Caudoviricetes sp.]DAP10458.1 MAG TPA: hypothetical protein [Caudoviricetes sp.]
MIILFNHLYSTHFNQDKSPDHSITTARMSLR